MHNHAPTHQIRVHKGNMISTGMHPIYINIAKLRCMLKYISYGKGYIFIDLYNTLTKTKPKSNCEYLRFLDYINFLSHISFQYHQRGFAETSHMIRNAFNNDYINFHVTSDCRQIITFSLNFWQLGGTKYTALANFSPIYYCNRHRCDLGINLLWTISCNDSIDLPQKTTI